MRINHHFCIYLANVTSQRYVSNTPSHFKIPLAKPLNFCDPHNWEVSLSELYFPSSYYNISQDNNSNLTIQYHIKGVVHTKNITIPHCTCQVLVQPPVPTCLDCFFSFWRKCGMLCLCAEREHIIMSV